MRRIYFILTLLLMPSLFLAQERRMGQPFITNYEPLDYDGEGQNWSICQDKSGLMYFANTGGMLVYDGKKWRKHRPEKDGVPLVLFKDSEERILVGGTSLIGTILPDILGFQRYKSLTNKLPTNHELGFVRSIVELDGLIYFQGQYNIVVWDGESLEVIDVDLPLSLIMPDKDGLLVVANGITYRLDLDTQMTEKMPWPEEIGFVRTILNLKSGKKLICTFENGLYWLEKGVVTLIDDEANDFLIKNNIQSAITLPDGNIAFGTKKDGVLITSSDLKPLWRLNKETGLDDVDIKCLFVDKESNLWIGKNRGISKVRYPIEYSYFNVIEEDIGTIEDLVFWNDELYLGTLLGTFKLIPNRKSLLEDPLLPTFEQLPLSSIDNFALRSSKEGLFFGGINGLHFYDGKQSKLLDNKIPRKIVPSHFDSSLFYIGYYEGFDIMQMKDGKVESIQTFDLPFNEYRGIAETKGRDLWVTTVVNGVLFVDLDDKMEVKSVKSYHVKDGLPSERDNLVYNVDDEIFFTTHQGIYVFDSLSQQFKPDSTFGKIYGDHSRFVFSFNYDASDDVWINAYDKRETGHAKKQSDGSWKLIDTDFHLMNQMQVFDIATKANGEVWFGGSDALVRYQKVDNQPSPPNFSAKVRQLTINGDSVIFGGTGSANTLNILDSDSRNTRFDVSALTFIDDFDIQYQYQLEGLEDTWSNWTSESFRIYTNLPSGIFRMKVRAKNDSQILSDEDYYAFQILPFWFETWWFRIVCLGVIIMLSYFIVSFFSQRKLIKKVEEMTAIRQVEKEKDQEIIREKQKGIAAMIEAQEEERQRIAKDLHDGIVQEIGSNVIRWRNLFSSSKMDGMEANELIDSLENANAELRTLSHQMMPKALSALGVVVALEGLLEGSLAPANIKFEYEHFGISGRFPKNIEITIYRISQELIQNIIKHSRATQVNVQLFKSGKDINLMIEDDGVGFNPKTLENGIGIHNIKSRLDSLNGSVNFEPSPQQGTLVTVKIPIDLHVENTDS